MPEGSLTHTDKSAQPSPPTPAPAADVAALMTGNANASNPEAVLGDEKDDKHIAGLQKKYDEAAKKVTDATAYSTDPSLTNPKYAELRQAKRDAADELQKARNEQGRRVKEALAAQRAGQPLQPKTTAHPHTAKK